MSVNVQIQDNFLPDDQFNKLRDAILDISGMPSKIHFPWGLTNILPPDVYKSDPIYNIQLNRALYSPSYIDSHLELVNPIIQKINPTLLIRVKANLTMRADKIVVHGYHSDIPNNKVRDIATTSIYYLNDNNGYTEFDTGDRVESVANRLLTFPANTMHSGSTCTDAMYRSVINFNYVKDDL